MANQAIKLYKENDTDKRVGINLAPNTNPGYTLDVNGNVRFRNMLTLYRSSTTAQDYPAGIYFTVNDTDNNKSYSSGLYAYQDHQTSPSGLNYVITPGGGLFIGSGEGPTNHYNAIKPYTGEDTFITADGTIWLQSNSQTVANRVGAAIITSGYIVPAKADTLTNGIGSIGTSNYHWSSAYIDNVRAFTGMDVFNTTANGSSYRMGFSDRSMSVYALMWGSRIANYGGRISFGEYSENSSGTLLSYRENYVLPTPNQGLTSNSTYNILTTKEVNLDNKSSYGAGYNNSYLKFYIPHEDSGSLFPVMRIGTGRGNGWCLGTISTNNILYFVYNDGDGTANTNATWFSLSPGDTRNAGYEIITSRFTASQTSYGIVTTGFQHFGGIKGFNYIYTYGIDGNGGAVRWSTDITGHNASGTITNELFYDTGNATNVTSGIWKFRQFSPNSTASTTTTGKYEDYKLPTVTTGRTDSPTYDILTSKSAVTIAQGGTGATTRLNALKALTNENVSTNANYFLTITTSWGKGGYTSVADAKTVLGITGTQYGSNHMGWKKVSITLTNGAGSVACTGVTASSVVQATRVGTFSDSSGGYSTHIGAAATDAGHVKVFSTANGTVTWSTYLWWSKTAEGG